MFPICKECLAIGCRFVVYFALQNPQVKQTMLDAMEARAARSQQGAKDVGEAAPTIVEGFKQSANIVVDVTTAPSSSTKKGRKRNANAANNIVVARTTRSKVIKNGRNPCNTK